MTNFLAPDWVMIGCAMPNEKVRLVASKDLNEAELHCVAQEMQTWSFTRMLPPLRIYHLTASMRTFVMVEADSYPSAFEGLFRQWSPDVERDQIDERRQIGHD